MGKHLTLDDRLVIQCGLKDGLSIGKIAKSIHKARSTVAREISNHIVFERTGSYGRHFNECVHRSSCKNTGLCSNRPNCVSKRCSVCGNSCNRKNCKNFEREICPKLSKSPYVCNGCMHRSRCTLEKHLYDAKKAQKEYMTTLKESREGFNFDEDEVKRIDDFVSERIRNGQSIYHICKTEENSIMCSERTIYRLVNAGALSVKNIDLPRKIRFKARKGKAIERKIDKKCRQNRTYKDYQAFMAENPELPVAEIDSVEGNKGGKVLLTVMLTNCNFMLAFIREKNTAQSVIDVFNELYEKLPKETYKKMFGVLLGDNGTEFSNPVAIEYENAESAEQRSRVFYCNPSSPYEKGKVENNHTLLRRIIPKGKSMDNYTQADINKAMSHINSYGRMKYNGVSPTKLFVDMYGEEVLHLLGQEEIASKDVELKPSLLS